MAPEQSCRNEKCSVLKPLARNEGVCACNLCTITHRNISGELRYLKQFKLHLILTLYYFENDHKRKQVHIQHTCTSVFLTQACGCAGVTPTHIEDPLVCHSVHSPALDAFGSNAMSWLPQNQSTPSWPTIYIVSNEINTEKLLNRKWLKWFIMKVETPVPKTIYSWFCKVENEDTLSTLCIFLDG